MFKTLGIGWQVGVPSGWGTYGLNLAIQLARKGVEPALLYVAERPSLTQAQADVLVPLMQRHAAWARQMKEQGTFDFPVLYALGDALSQPPEFVNLKGRPEVGVVFFESGVVPQANLAAADRFALIVTGSSWNTEVLQRHGFARAVYCPQGVDLDLFHPGPRTGFFRDRFAVFSGGKLEYRKGQDLVVAAFKRFYERHPDALLVTAWHNPWPKVAAEGLSRSPYTVGAPGVTADGKLDAAQWLRANGLPDAAFFDPGPQANAAMPPLLRELDLAVFPNRCEGGTNLVAMECMACGVPTVLSRNTGHLDLIQDGNCYPLELQIPMGAVTNRPDLDGWGESSIDELVMQMERAYDDRAEARKRGDAGAAFMTSWGWSAQVDRLIAAITPYC
jgi:glycosyltransferase involved in cell wall biosynthesis